MKYVDEELLKARKELERKAKEEKEERDKVIEEENKESIFNGEVHIDGELVAFEERKNEELHISIWMPKELEMLPEEMIAAVYPMGNRPKLVYTGRNINMSIAFNPTNHQIPNNNVADFLQYYKKMLENMGPKNRITSTGIVDSGEYHIGCIEAITQAMDTSVKNHMFYISINGNLLMGNITYPLKFRKRQEVISREMISSLKVLEEEC